MARPSIPTLNEFRKSPISREQVRTFSYVLRAIALGRLPGEQALSRQAVLTRLLAALVMSAALWYYVTDQENPVVRSRPFTLQVVVEHLPKGLAVRSGLTSVTVTARGLQDDVNSPQQLIPYVDLSGVSPAAREVTVPVQLSGKKPNLQYTISPATISLNLEPISSKIIPIVFVPQTSPPAGIGLGQTSISPTELLVTGPGNSVAQVNEAVVSAPLNYTPQSPDEASFTESLMLTPQLVDKSGAPVADAARLSFAAQVKVVLSFSVTYQARSLPIAPSIGPIPAGYQLTDIPQPEPPTVTVLGPPGELSTISFVTTDPISLIGITHDTTVTTHLAGLPPNVVILYPKGKVGASLQANPPWKVHVAIAPAKGTIVLPVGVVVDNVSPFLHAIPSAKYLSVYMSGPYPVISKLGPLAVHLDLAGKRQGVYTFHPTLSLPSGITYSLTPTTVKVVLTP